MTAVARLDYDGIAAVYRMEPTARYYPDYSDRPSAYMVTLPGSRRRRRVWTAAIGNVAVQWINVGGQRVFCETALDAALHRVGVSESCRATPEGTHRGIGGFGYCTECGYTPTA